MLLDAKNRRGVVREGDSSINTFHAWDSIATFNKVKYAPGKVFPVSLMTR